LRFKTIKLAGAQIPEAENSIAGLNPNFPFTDSPGRLYGHRRRVRAG
jgi:hypothetical protein